MLYPLSYEGVTRKAHGLATESATRKVTGLVAVTRLAAARAMARRHRQPITARRASLWAGRIPKSAIGIEPDGPVSPARTLREGTGTVDDVDTKFRRWPTIPVAHHE
jgi:hypothetical protein